MKLFLYNKVFSYNKVYLALSLLFFIQSGCISTSVRFPSSTDDIYGYSDLKQNLLIAAQNNILFYIPDDTQLIAQKTEIDSRCQQIEKPLWAEKLSVYLNSIRQNPEWFTKMHVIEIKKGDSAKVIIEKDFDGASVLSIQFGKVESRGLVSLKTNIPCVGAHSAEYLGKELVKTDYEFPSVADLKNILLQAPERDSVKRFDFSNQFTSYLAERGFILKFNHDQSFEKNTQQKFILAEILNNLSSEVNLHQNVTSSNPYVNLWMKILNDSHKSNDIVQMFSIEHADSSYIDSSYTDSKVTQTININQQQVQSGLRYNTMGLPYLFVSYNVKNDVTSVAQISDLNNCLASKSIQRNYQLQREPSSEEIKSNSIICSKK